MGIPYIICHMVTSIDGKVTGEFLFREEARAATEVYYELNRTYKTHAFACGRVTMEESFTEGWYPDLSQYQPMDYRKLGVTPMDCCYDDMKAPYAIAFDPKGKLGWKSNIIVDEDPGYGGARIIEVLTEQADPRYVTYLEAMEIPYLFGGKNEIELPLVLQKLYDIFGIDTLLLEGGSIMNGSFARENLIDEISIVVAPVTGNAADRPLFADGGISDYTLAQARQYEGGVLHLRYIKTDTEENPHESITDQRKSPC